MSRRGLRRVVPLLLVASIAAACSSSDSLSSTSDTSVVTSTSGVAATTAPPSVASTTSTSPPSTTTTTTMATTTTISTTTTTTPPPTTSAAAPPTTDVAAAPAPATAFVTNDTELLEIDVATADPIRVVTDDFGGDGVFRGGLRLSPDRSTIWFGEGYEDGWYGCQSSIGSFGRVDVATGAVEIIGPGAVPEPSADGELVAYLTSELCLPDPENPEFWVLTPNDRVVVRNIATGEERQFVTAAPPDTYGAPGAVEWAGFSPAGNLLVLVGDGRLFDVEPNGPDLIQDHPVALPDVRGFPAGVTADALLTIDFGDEGSSDLYAVDAGSGDPTLLASTETFLSVGVSSGGRIAAMSSTEVVVADGSDVTVIDNSGEQLYFDLDW